MKRIAALFLCLALLLSGCGQAKKELQKFDGTTIDSGFDTVITLIGYTTSQAEFDQYFASMKEQFFYYNQLFDKYHTYADINNIKTINDNAGIKPVPVCDELYELLTLAREYYDLTNGAFDITQGAVMNIWHEYRDDGAQENSIGIETGLAVPSLDELQAAYNEDGWEYIEMNDEDKTVYITDPHVSLDVGGIAKGYATEKIAQDLQQQGLISGAINGGGNVRILGSKPDGNNWTIGITEPDNSNKNIDLIYWDGAVSCVTSGDYQRFYINDGVRYHHILDPFTLYPATTCRSVTIVTPDSGIADILSTALFVLSYEEGLHVLTSYNEEHPDATVEAFWIFEMDQRPESTLSIGLEIDGYWVVPTEGLRPQLKAFGATASH